MAEAFNLKVCQISQGLSTISLFYFGLDVLCFSLLEPYFNKGYIYICQSTKQKSSAFLEIGHLATSLTCSAKTHSLAKSCIDIMINGSVVNALVDSGSTDNFFNPKQVQRLSLTILPSRETVSMASFSLSTKMQGYCFATIVLHDQTYEDVKLYVLPNFCADVILGQNWQSNHQSVTI